MKSIKISDYFQIVKPTYVYLRIIPDISIRNYNSSNIAKTIHNMQKGVFQRIRKEEKKLIVETPVKCAYMIDIYKNKVDFYFIVPSQYKSIANEKIRATWPKVTIEEVSDIKPFTNEAIKYEINYKKEDAMSLDVDKKNNEPLNHILNVIDIMQEEDRVSILYNFIPISQKGWTIEYDRTIQSLKNRHPIEKEKFSFKYVGKLIATNIFDLIETFQEALNELLGSDKKDNSQLSLLDLAISTINTEKDLQQDTIKKRSSTVLDTQLLVISESNNKIRLDNNALAVCQSYKSVDGDNELIYKKLEGNRLTRKLHIHRKIDVDINKFRLPIESNKLSTEECKNLIQLPGRELLQEYKFIKQIDTVQTEVPIQLQHGVIRAGRNEYRGIKKDVYHTEDKELKNTAACLCGPNRSGKSTLIANMVYDLIKAKRTVILPDFCGKCQLSDELAKVIPKDKILNIKCDDWENIQGFGYNEIVPKDNSIFELYNCAKMKSAKLKELINLINDGDNDLEGRMERYLEYAALVVFVCNGSVNEVFKMLKDHKLRHMYIDKIPNELKEDMEEYVTELSEIDEWSKGIKDCPAEIIGTKQGHIAAILSRVHRLKQNAYIEKMLKKDTGTNLNLIIEMQKGILICIRMYDSMFATQQQKDIYVSYWITKVWGALQKRFCDFKQEDLIQTVILIDELYQTKNCEKYLTMILSQMPKYRTKLILSCHHLGQIDTIQEELKSASCSYMFIAGSNKKNFQAMKEEFEDKGFSLEDLLHLKRYTSLNLLAYEDGYFAGITQLPPPIK